MVEVATEARKFTEVQNKKLCENKILDDLLSDKIIFEPS
jgi:hypothetical protein